jgi:hypothetical protein
MPPCPLQVPLPVDVVVVPSEHVVAAPAAGAAGVLGAADAGAAGAGVAADAAAFWMPPWPLHVPLPVDVLVVPSAQVLVAPLAAGAAAGAAGAAVFAGAAAGAIVVLAAFCTPP